MDRQRTYISIDLKSFYASVECVERHLDPMTTHLVVADASRTEKTICLAVSPSLKAHGISGRARLFEVIQRVGQINQERLSKVRHFTGISHDDIALKKDPSLELSYIVAPPRMARYIEISSKIYSVYLKYIAPEDIHAYSIDEVFLDVTEYLSTYQMNAYELAKTMIREVLETTGITATAGIGTNLYLAKIAMDIVAKHIPPDKDGVRIAILDEQSFRKLLWDHKPLTDFWRIGKGTANHLHRLGIHTMGELARYSTYNEDHLYKEFGIDAELLIDHAWGMEPCLMKHIKAFRPSFHSIVEGQVLSEPYTHEKARIIVKEMMDALTMQLVDQKKVTGSLTLEIGYDRENLSCGIYHGEIRLDHYGRAVPKPAHGTVKLSSPTNLNSRLMPEILKLYESIIDPKLFVRRVTLSANKITSDDGYVQLDLFMDLEKMEKEKRLQEAMLTIQKRFGKNALLKGTNFEDGATMRDRNGQIGGHKA